MRYQDDAAEVEGLHDALLKLELSGADSPSHADTVSRRRAVVDASADLRRDEPGASGDDELDWERIRWTDAGPLPHPGLEMTRATTHEDGQRMFHRGVVVRVRPDLEPGWVRVKLRSLE